MTGWERCGCWRCCQCCCTRTSGTTSWRQTRCGRCSTWPSTDVHHGGQSPSGAASAAPGSHCQPNAPCAPTPRRNADTWPVATSAAGCSRQASRVSPFANLAPSWGEHSHAIADRSRPAAAAGSAANDCAAHALWSTATASGRLAAAAADKAAAAPGRERAAAATAGPAPLGAAATAATNSGGHHVMQATLPPYKAYQPDSPHCRNLDVAFKRISNGTSLCLYLPDGCGPS